jgi:hypothetical protein
LDCSSNTNLKKLPPLPPSLRYLNCSNNDLTELPPFPPNIQEVYCFQNRLSGILPELPLSLSIIRFDSKDNCFIYRNQFISHIRSVHEKLRKFRFLFYCLRFKTRFRDWLWDKIRRPKIEAQYHPSRVAELLENGVDLEDLEVALDS